MRAWLPACLLLFAVVPAFGAERPLLPGQSEIAFAVRQMGVEVSGTFGRFDATLEFEPESPATARARVRVEIASIDTGLDEADETALSTPWLDAAGHPTAVFEGVGLRRLSADRYRAVGRLSLRGVSRRVTVPLRLMPGSGGVTLAKGELTISRTAFGIGGGAWDESDLIADKVTIRFRLAFGPPPTKKEDT